MYKKYDEVVSRFVSQDEDMDHKIKKLQEVIDEHDSVIAKCCERLGLEANGHTSVGAIQHPPSSPPSTATTAS